MIKSPLSFISTIFKDKCAGGKCLEQKPEFKEQRIVVVKQEQAVEQQLKSVYFRNAHNQHRFL